MSFNKGTLIMFVALFSSDQYATWHSQNNHGLKTDLSLIPYSYLMCCRLRGTHETGYLASSHWLGRHLCIVVANIVIPFAWWESKLNWTTVLFLLIRTEVFRKLFCAEFKTREWLGTGVHDTKFLNSNSSKNLWTTLC